MAEYLECGAGTEYDAVLAFFTPNGKKKGFVVMTFGPKNVPAFYTAMMRILQDEWIILFYNTKRVVKSDTSLANIFCNSKTIIDDRFIY